MTFVRVGLLIVLVASLGCGDSASDPMATEFTSKRKALKAKLAEKKGDKASAKVVAKNAARAKAASQSAGFARVSHDFVYDSTGKRDPFRNFKWERPDRLRNPDVSGPLEQFDLAQLQLVAVVWKTGNARALVQDPSGVSYIVAEGARLGKNEGTIIAINDNEVRVKETYVDFLGRETTKDIDLRMRGSEGG